MSTTAAKNNRTVKLVGLVNIIAGIILIVAAIATWGVVTSQLKAENITLGDDVIAFAGNQVNGPIDAYIQADIINKHALAATDGKTYAELAQDDPTRAVVMNGSFLRASLFTSVIAYGVALFAGGLGFLSILTGYALRKIE